MHKTTMTMGSERWPLRAPLRITGYTFTHVELVVVRLSTGDAQGAGEAFGVYYRNETPESMLRQLEAVRAQVESGLTREALQYILPPGGARNALDCALWDIEAKAGLAAYAIAGLPVPKPVLSYFTCGAGDPQEMAAAALAYSGARAIKLKLTGDAADADRVRTVRAAIGVDVRLAIDANQGFNRASLETLMPILLGCGVELIEQPFPIGDEALLETIHLPIPTAADESFQSIADLPKCAGRFDAINIKLDKCGGLTEALAIAEAARKMNLRVMVGNMPGTSLSIAPAFALAQICDAADLDGPLFLRDDRAQRIVVSEGTVSCPDGVWGYPDWPK